MTRKERWQTRIGRELWFVVMTSGSISNCSPTASGLPGSPHTLAYHEHNIKSDHNLDHNHIHESEQDHEHAHAHARNYAHNYPAQQQQQQQHQQQQQQQQPENQNPMFTGSISPTPVPGSQPVKVWPMNQYPSLYPNGNACLKKRGPRWLVNTHRFPWNITIWKHSFNVRQSNFFLL